METTVHLDMNIVPVDGKKVMDALMEIMALETLIDPLAVLQTPDEVFTTAIAEVAINLEGKCPTCEIKDRCPFLKVWDAISNDDRVEIMTKHKAAMAKAKELAGHLDD
jgi:hypothetical protein